ncbi:LTA synthase family protein [Gramella sp. KN1008]|uniref:LTA synthase family protein n=1 Tax=Gramella sp. KN1008 TaxID=2529298 RepID=UPI001038F301|nr:alkaline phosphatase family protein [Gramella sp. KN1008]TBW28640.1 alkaline phosphatase family protein [Gramella sp. KN1008]
MRFKKSQLLKKLEKSSITFALLSIIFLVFLLLTSLIEVSLAELNHNLNSSFISLLGWSILEDIRFFLTWMLPAYLIYLLLSLLSPKFARGLYIVVFILFYLIQFSLLFYFNTTLVMLGSDLFGYSIQEITQTLGASDSLGWEKILIFSIVLVFLSFLLVRFSPKPKMKWQLSVLLPVLSLLFLLFGSSESLNASELSSDFERNLVKNKSEHFYNSAYSYFNPDIYEVDIYAESYLGDLSAEYASIESFEYVDEGSYPFLRKELNRDVLSPFLETKDEAPNIVIIVVEGLGRAFTNEGAYLGNFTPFLDSLSTKSLYWPNFLSNGGRTFAVLPSLLGSLPFAKNGFMEMGDNMPDQLSLLNLLGQNGYETSFYHGGKSGFDNMGVYLKKNNADRIIDEDDFPKAYKKIPSKLNGFSWGYGDKELYRNYLEKKQSASGNSPQLDVLLTISTHDPFFTDDPERYDRLFEERLTKLGFDEAKKQEYRNYKKQYATILYADEALKNFMNSWKELDDYDNTIFLITGDHRIPEIPMASKIDRYHVPLILYSPLLKRTAEFRSVSSHFDVAPSLISFLKTNYNLQIPTVNSFLGQGLDTTRSFHNFHKIPLMQTKTDLRDFVMGEYHLNGEDLYRLTPDMAEESVTDEAKKEELLYAFDQFKRKNAEIINGKRMIPDSITQK